MTTKPVQLPFCRREDVEGEIRKIAREKTEHVLPLEHARMRMLEREINLRQIFQVLRNGELVSDIVWDTKEDKGWKCKFCRIVAGVKVTVVAKLIDKNGTRCLIVTVW